MNAEFVATTIGASGVIGAALKVRARWNELSAGPGSPEAASITAKIKDLDERIAERGQTYAGIISDTRARDKITKKGLVADMRVIEETDPNRKRNLLIRRALIGGAAQGFMGGVFVTGGVELLTGVTLNLLAR